MVQVKVCGITRMADAEKAVDMIRQQVDEEAHIIFGFAVDEDKVEEVDITVIIAGCS